MMCRDVSAFLSDYLDGDLAPEVRASFEAHLAECPECVAYLRGFEAAVRLAGRASHHPADEVHVPEPLVAAILAARRAT